MIFCSCFDSNPHPALKMQSSPLYSVLVVYAIGSVRKLILVQSFKILIHVVKLLWVQKLGSDEAIQ